ncbi:MULTISPECIES: GNAT family N-acetyltransferase [unclassified Streptomyces]|jgi:RimJ/RimL family protein N-acetyltransferase|uniref:GNAT family N-acetyltransferase n=2 Tax=unclassified Streptomyces TaxID=2593676 RepID=UPI0011E6769B|nr:GNAT family protein [Streptomyces sp. sk2.1]TXS61342.1 N-acetyltransferase [Streptomyces sp. sk2.1]
MMNKHSVTLAPITGSDCEIISQWTSSKAWVYASGIRAHMSPADVESFFGRVDDEFLLVCTDDGQAIGVVSWKQTDTPGNYVVGSMIGDSEMWGAGFGLESVIHLVGMLFDSRNAHRVEFNCGVFNKGAVENFCSGIMRIEGILRDYYFLDGQYYDALIGSILRDEYYAMREPSSIVPSDEKAAARLVLEEFIKKNPIIPHGGSDE